jgi:cbb3-type cytochrome oxidase maturation protein
MSVLMLVIPLAFLLAAAFLLGFVWAVRNGQYDDLQTPPSRMALEDDDTLALTRTPSDQPPQQR